MPWVELVYIFKIFTDKNKRLGSVHCFCSTQGHDHASGFYMEIKPIRLGTVNSRIDTGNKLVHRCTLCLKAKSLEGKLVGIA